VHAVGPGQRKIIVRAVRCTAEIPIRSWQRRHCAVRARSGLGSRISDKSAYAATGAAIRSTVHNGRMPTRNPDWDALRDAIALVRARTDAETDLMLPRVLDANDDGTVTVDPTFVRELAALVTISRDLSKMVDPRAARPVLGPEARRGGFPPRTLGLIFG